MSLSEWLIQRHGLAFEATDTQTGEELVGALCRALAAAGFDFDAQKSVLLEAPDVYCDTAFLEACIDRVKLIERLQAERRAALERHLARCQSGVSRRQPRPQASDVARHRFVPCWPLTAETVGIVDDMLGRLAGAGYLEATAETLRDLRQGFGYYRQAEDPYRLRRPVRWLRSQNALHWWLCGLLGDRGGSPLIAVAEGGVGRWVTAASLFADRNGRAFTYAQLEHGCPASADQRRWLDATIPLRPLPTA